MCEWLRKNKFCILGIFIIILLISLFICSSYLFSRKVSLKQEEWEKSIKIPSEHEKIEIAQKEMETLSSFLMDNARIVIWIRGIFFTIWMAIIGFVLKTYYIDGKSYEVNKHKCPLMLLLLIIMIIAFLLEFTIQGQQVLLTNRIAQLDIAINNAAFCEDQASRLQDIFRSKDIIEFPLSCDYFMLLSWNIFSAPTFFIFYLVMFIFWLIFFCFLKDP